MQYPLKVVVHKTGLSPETLRAWERRYTGIEPDRDDRNRRVYSEELLEKLILVSILIDQGYRISDLVTRSSIELRTMTEHLNQNRPAEFRPDPSLERAVDSVLRLDPDAFWDELERATTVYGRLDLIDEFVFPLARQVHRARTGGSAKEVHSRFLDTSLRSYLSTLLAPVGTQVTRGSVVLALTLGQSEGIGVIAAAVHVRAAGCRPVVLGGPVVAEEIVEAAETVRAAAVILSAVTETYDTGILNEMARVRRGVKPEIPVYFGGRFPTNLAEDIQAAGVHSIANMDDLRAVLETEVQGPAGAMRPSRGRAGQKQPAR